MEPLEWLAPALALVHLRRRGQRLVEREQAPLLLTTHEQGFVQRYVLSPTTRLPKRVQGRWRNSVRTEVGVR